MVHVHAHIVYLQINCNITLSLSLSLSLCVCVCLCLFVLGCPRTCMFFINTIAHVVFVCFKYWLRIDPVSCCHGDQIDDIYFSNHSSIDHRQHNFLDNALSARSPSNKELSQSPGGASSSIRPPDRSIKWFPATVGDNWIITRETKDGWRATTA